MTSKKKIEKATHNLSDRPYLNIIEVANLTGVSRWTIYRNVIKGIVPAIRLSRRLTLIRRKDIDTLFDDVEPYEILSTGERKPIEDWYTLDDITEKYGILRHWIRKIISAENIPTKKDGTRTLVAKNKIDSYFKKKGFDKTLSNLAEWYTASEITELYGMNTNAVHIFASRYAIPKKRVNGKLYYSKQHIDKLKR
ncbi:hypothetical protein EZS27_020460 [termite gut metagenome]|uniref:HTH merR-type domain-containing protein n=1 Tax=termite gut metagenome TaxID=433724 RepID=A0A5J4RBJ6_9ZZZZ